MPVMCLSPPQLLYLVSLRVFHHHLTGALQVSWEGGFAHPKMAWNEARSCSDHALLEDPNPPPQLMPYPF